MPTANAINANDIGLIRYQGVGVFDSVTTTQYNTLVGAASNGISNISPGTTGQVLTSQGAAANPVYADASAVTVTTYDTSDTWTKKSNTKNVAVYVFNGGGGGGSGRRGASGSAGGGGGGGGGGMFYMTAPATFFGATETVTIGAVALGGAPQTVNDTDGNPGQPYNGTFFGNLTAYDPNDLGTMSYGPGGSTGGVGLGFGGTGRSFYAPGAGSGTQGGGGDIGDGVNGIDTTFSVIGASSGGGGGSGADSVTIRTGGRGANLLDPFLINTILTGGAGGSESGTIDGGAGNAQATGSSAGGFPLGGSGGGGGGGQSAGLVAGNGGAGGLPGGGGGGGGGSLNGTNSGAGGNGGQGRVIVIEFA